MKTWEIYSSVLYNSLAMTNPRNFTNYLLLWPEVTRQLLIENRNEARL